MNLDKYKDLYEQKISPILEKHLLIVSKIMGFLALVLTPFFYIAALFSSKVKESKGSNKLSPETTKIIAQKHVLYQSLAASHCDSHGFIMHEECDSLIFTGLYGVSVSNIDIEAAKDESGKWHRRPLKDCYPKHSKSTISMDMLLGLLVYLYWLGKSDKKKAGRIAKELYDYGKANNWIMGNGDPGRTLMRPGMQATLAELVYHLTGQNDRIARNLPQVYGDNLTDYQLHLAMLDIYLRGCLKGYITKKMLKVVKYAIATNPSNAFFHYVFLKYNGKDMSKVATILLGKHFPNDKLPSNHEHRTDYLWQRPSNSLNWLPDSSAPRKEHSGADYLFLSALVLLE